ncbi:hypothetical protein, partial [Pseudomonas aeruginosa]|uniref:hypothetical protein n=1 Tax=Pseudomonas aeruginosa TaxID=287 RepID=UPI0031B76CCA
TPPNWPRKCPSCSSTCPFAIHGEFLRGFDKLEVMAMDYETIAERLLSEGVVGSTQAANATANIAMKWIHCPGISFDFKKRMNQTYRAR